MGSPDSVKSRTEDGNDRLDASEHKEQSRAARGNNSGRRDSNEARILQTPEGIIYGFVKDGVIYLEPSLINPDTAIHEYTYLWERGKTLMKQTDIWNEVVNDPNYKSIQNDEDAIASEALSRVSGAKNAAKLEQMAQQMLDEAKGTMRKAETRGLIQNIKDALNQFWSWVNKNLFEIENFGSVEEVTDLGELSEGNREYSIIKCTEGKELAKAVNQKNLV